MFYLFPSIGLLSLDACDLHGIFVEPLGPVQVPLHSPSPSTCIHLLQSFRISVLSEFWGQLHIHPGKPQSWTCRFLQGRQVIRQTWPKRKVCQAYFHKRTKREKTAWLPYYRLISGRVILDLQEQSGSETKEDGEQIRILKDLTNRSSPCESFAI